MEKVIDNVLVIKIGTSTLIETVDGSEQIDTESFRRIRQQVIELQNKDTHVILVSSGAITAGMVAVGQRTRPEQMRELQRLASIGWRHVLNAWDDALENRQTGGILLTGHDMVVRGERNEVLRVTHTMLKHGDVVIVNENDVTSHEQIAFGDNDTLSATYASHIARSSLFGNRVRLVLLTDVDGLYKDAADQDSLISTVDDPRQYRHLAGVAGSENGTGGMQTKFDAYDICYDADINMWIANGRTENAIQRALDHEIGTHFLPKLLSQ